MAAHQCPHCGSGNVRASYRRRSDLLHVVYRCRNCKRHFTLGKSRGQLLALAALVGLLVLVAGYALLTLSGGREDDPEVVAPVERHTPVSEQDRKLAQQGDADAQYRLGMEYWAASDYLKALPWLKAAAGKGLAGAKYQLGVAYLYGRGTVQNFRFALDQFQEASRLGHLDAQHALGGMYRDGLGTAVNKEIAYVWLNVAAARGHDIAASERDRLALELGAEEMLRAQEASFTELERQLGKAAPTAKPEEVTAQVSRPPQANSLPLKAGEPTTAPQNRPPAPTPTPSPVSAPRPPG